VEQIPSQHLIDVSGVVIDISNEVAVAKFPAEYVLSNEDIIRHEMRNGALSLFNPLPKHKS
jgi:hypothetical protein